METKNSFITQIRMKKIDLIKYLLKRKVFNLIISIVHMVLKNKRQNMLLYNIHWCLTQMMFNK